MKLKDVAIAGLLVIVAGQAVTSCVERRRRRAERVAAANELADHSRTEYWLRGQLVVAARYLHQGTVQLDQSQRRQRQQAVLAVGLRFERDTLRRALAVQPTVTDSAVRVKSHLDTNGVHVQTDVVIAGVGPIVGMTPAARVFYDVAIAPIDLQVGVSCEGPNARVLVTGPRWSDLTISNGTMTADVCNPAPPEWQPFTLRAPSVPTAGILFGAGVLACKLNLFGIC